VNEFSIEIGAGLGPLAGKIWRIGIMGYSCRPDNVMLCLSALGSVLSDMGMKVHVGDRGSRRPSGVCRDARQGRAAETEEPRRGVEEDGRP